MQKKFLLENVILFHFINRIFCVKIIKSFEYSTLCDIMWDKSVFLKLWYDFYDLEWDRNTFIITRISYENVILYEFYDEFLSIVLILSHIGRWLFLTKSFFRQECPDRRTWCHIWPKGPLPLLWLCTTRWAWHTFTLQNERQSTALADQYPQLEKSDRFFVGHFSVKCPNSRVKMNRNLWKLHEIFLNNLKSFQTCNHHGNL